MCVCARVPVRVCVRVFASGRIPSITHGLGPQAETRSHVGDSGRCAEEQRRPRRCVRAHMCVSV